MEQAVRQEFLKQWYIKYVDYFRKEYEGLSADEKKDMDNTNNFLSPCQIEVFWITDPDYQLAVQSNFNDRPDKEIIINGPYKPHEFHSKVIPILKEDRWMRGIAQNLPREYEQFNTLGERMASEIYKLVEMCKNQLFVPEIRDRRVLSMMPIEDTRISIRAINIAELDHIQEANQVIQEIKLNVKIKQEQELTSTEPTPCSDTKFMGFGAHMFPPILIGPEPKRSVEELIYNSSNHWLRNKILDLKIDNRQIIVNRDGFVFVESSNQKDALKVLNLVMSHGAFYGFPLHAVREHELVQADYNTQDLTISTMQWNTGTRRANLVDSCFNLQYNRTVRRTAIKLETMQEILSNTEKLLGYEDLSEDLRLLNDGYTHFNNSEFAPSFIIGWSLIEMHYHEIWKSILYKNKNGSEHSDKIKKISRLAIDTILTILESQDKIDKKSYETVMNLKGKRNMYYHQRKQVTRKDAECCIGYALKLRVEKIVPRICLSENLMLPEKS